MTKDQAQKVLDTKVQAVTALLADIRKLAVDNRLNVYIPVIDVDGGYDYSGRPKEEWQSSSYDEEWASSSYSC